MVLPAEGFNKVPADVRSSGFYPEVDPSLAGFFFQQQRVLIVGQRLSSGSAPVATPVLVPGDGSAADALFGRGSMLAHMVRAFRAINLTNELWALALDDQPGNGTAYIRLYPQVTSTEAGTLSLYVGTTRIPVAVGQGNNNRQVAEAIYNAVNANPDLPIRSVGSPNRFVQLSFCHRGTVGNDLEMSVNRRGALGGERTPAGLTGLIIGTGTEAPNLLAGPVSLTGGGANPDMTAAIAAMGDEPYDFIIHPYTDSASLDAWDREMERRWGPLSQTFSTYFTAYSGSVSAIWSWGKTRGVNGRGGYGSALGTHKPPTPAYLLAARYGAVAARALSNHPARPLHGLKVDDQAPAPSDRLTFADRETLLNAGVATCHDANGVMVIDRAISFYRQSATGGDDTAFLDVTTAATLRRVIREIRFLIEQRFLSRRVILVDDGTPIGAGVPHATSALIRAHVLGHYDRLQLLGLTEDKAAFARLFMVNRDPTNPNRINMLYTPDIANPLIILATKVQFSLDWPADLIDAV